MIKKQFIPFLSVFVFLFLAIAPKAFASESLFSLAFTGYGLLQTIILILLALAVVFFFYGIVSYMASAGNPEARKKGIHVMIYGIVGLFVMLSVWGLVAILQNTFDIGPSAGVVVYPAPQVH